MSPTTDEQATADPHAKPGSAAPAAAESDLESERRRISDYLADVSRLEAELVTVRQRNAELREEVLYQRRRIEREEEARLQLMQLLDNSQRLLGNAQRHTQQLLGGNQDEIFAIALPEAATPSQEAEPAPQQAAAPQVPAPPSLKPRRRWWSRG